MYRFVRAETDPNSQVRTEKYDILTLEGAQSVRYELPEDASLVWAPSPDAQLAAR